MKGRGCSSRKIDTEGCGNLDRSGTNCSTTSENVKQPHQNLTTKLLVIRHRIRHRAAMATAIEPHLQPWYLNVTHEARDYTEIRHRKTTALFHGITRHSHGTTTAPPRHHHGTFERQYYPGATAIRHRHGGARQKVRSFVASPTLVSRTVT